MSPNSDPFHKLGEAFEIAGYDTAGVTELLGSAALAAYDRGFASPVQRAVRASTGRDQLASLVRLFLLGEDVVVDDLGGWPVAEALDVGLVRLGPSGVSSHWSVRPHEGIGRPSLLVSDFPAAIRGALAADHVVGAGGASRTLEALVPRRPADRTLDLGTGCGVQAVALLNHSVEVIATDTNERALVASALSAGLSGHRSPELVRTSLFDGIEGPFDLIVTNPPFVMAPPPFVCDETLDGHEYRDSPLPGDDLVATILGEAPRLLAPGGRLVMLGNWIHPVGGSWVDRVLPWCAQEGLTWIAQREVLDICEYAEMWLRDDGSPMGAGSGREDEYLRWLNHLQQLGAEAVGFGWIVFEARPGPSQILIEDVRAAPGLPTSEEVEAQLAALAQRPDPGTLLASTPRISDGVTEVSRVADVAFGAGQPLPRTLVRLGGWRSEELLDSPTGWLLDQTGRGVGAGELLTEGAEALGLDPEEVLVAWLVGVRVLMEKGFATLDPPL